jgi:serine/threonine-protein kinase
MSAMIQVILGPDRGLSFSIAPGGVFTVGRSQTTDTRLTDASVSRLHCQIEFDGQRAQLLGVSTKGTLLNGKPVTREELRHGDIIRIGGTEIRFALTSLAEAETLLQPGGQAPSEAEPANALSLLGQQLGNYQLDVVLARGQTGVVYRATDQRDGVEVALKVLQPEFTREEDDKQRFARAMKTVIGLDHPNLVKVLAAGKTGPYCWIAMELVQGESMTQVIQRQGVAGMLDWRYGYRVAVHVARALSYAHDLNIAHRDVTPSNILWRAADKTALLGDLMLAKALEGALARQVTKSGELLGEVAYLSPERTYGTSGVDGRADLYGLGATVYALLTGRPPFTAGTLQELIPKIRGQEPEKPKKYQLAIPDLFQGVVLRLLAKRPEDRHAGAAELLGDLERVGKFSGAAVE